MKNPINLVSETLPFTLDLYQKMRYKVVTEKENFDVEIIRTDLNDCYPIAAIVKANDGKQFVAQFGEHGDGRSLPYELRLVRVYKFSPKDWCLMKLKDNNDEWTLSQFSHIHKWDETISYVSTGGKHYDICIPYNDETSCLIGTKGNCPDKYKLRLER
jgi:hypothetical protein